MGFVCTGYDRRLDDDLLFIIYVGFLVFVSLAVLRVFLLFLFSMFLNALFLVFGFLGVFLGVLILFFVSGGVRWSIRRRGDKVGFKRLRWVSEELKLKCEGSEI